MRTTLTLDAAIASALKKLAQRTAKPLKYVVNETLRAGLLAQKAAGGARPYRLEPTDLGGPNQEFNVDKALAFSDALEDAEIVRKLQQRK